MTIQADVSDLESIRRMYDAFLDAFGRIDLLVNNAGVGLTAPFLKTTPELFETVINTDLRGTSSARSARRRR